MSTESLKQKLNVIVKSYEDFPQKGVNFRDIHPLMADPVAREEVLQLLIERYYRLDCLYYAIFCLFSAPDTKVEASHTSLDSSRVVTILAFLSPLRLR